MRLENDSTNVLLMRAGKDQEGGREYGGADMTGLCVFLFAEAETKVACLLVVGNYSKVQKVRRASANGSTAVIPF